MQLSDYDFHLPEDRIASEPLAERDAARLLVARLGATCSEHRAVRDLPDLLAPGDLLVVNDTRVFASRLFARRATGGAVELLFLEPVSGGSTTWRAMAHPARRLKSGERLTVVQDEVFAHLVERPPDQEDDLGAWNVALEDAAGHVLDPQAVFEGHGHIPLPPYIEREDTPADAERYQTVYASEPGAVAAPTAGLHFTPGLLSALEERGIERAQLTLHVGPGTFRPVQVEDVRDHRMHRERYVLPEETVAAIHATRARGGRVVAIGTTCVRVLEGAVDGNGDLVPGAGSTDVFLVPGHRFRHVDALLTNFHLPRSTLLLLVSALAGRQRTLDLYAEAIEEGYRFYSYGDAMLLL